MNIENKLIQFGDEIPLGELHDPVEESEISMKIKGMSREEARTYTRSLGISWRQVIANGWR